MIDSVSNDFNSEDRCPMCGWSFISTLHKHTVCVFHHLRRAIAFKRRPSEQRTTVTFGGFPEAI
jgi:hypothetical protein